MIMIGIFVSCTYYFLAQVNCYLNNAHFITVTIEWTH